MMFTTVYLTSPANIIPLCFPFHLSTAILRNTYECKFEHTVRCKGWKKHYLIALGVHSYNKQEFKAKTSGKHIEKPN